MHNQESDTLSGNNNVNVNSKGYGLPYRWIKYFKSLKNKLRFIIFVTALLMTVALFIMSYFLIRHYLTRDTYDNLQTLAELKHEQTDNYFYQLKGQIILASKDVVVREAMNEFADAFGTIESDSYELPDYPDLYTMTTALEDYYSAVIIPGLNKVPAMEVTLPEILPYSDKTRIIQFLYIGNNHLPFGYKNRMLAGGDGSSYSYAHQKYQSYFRELMTNVRASDVLLIDAKSGDIVYTFQKNIDLGSNIYNGSLKGTNLAMSNIH